MSNIRQFGKASYFLASILTCFLGKEHCYLTDWTKPNLTDWKMCKMITFLWILWKIGGCKGQGYCSENTDRSEDTNPWKVGLISYTVIFSQLLITFLVPWRTLSSKLEWENALTTHKMIQRLLERQNPVHNAVATGEKPNMPISNTSPNPSKIENQQHLHPWHHQICRTSNKPPAIPPPRYMHQLSSQPH